MLPYSLVENQLTERADDYSAQTHSGVSRQPSVPGGSDKKYDASPVMEGEMK